MAGQDTSGSASHSKASASRVRDTPQPQSRITVVVAWVSLVCTLASVAAAFWAGWEARRANAYEQRDASSAVITSPHAPSGECVPIRKGKAVTLKGTAKMAKGAKLWEITQPINDNSLWPGPVASLDASSSSWELSIPFVGADGDKGHRYTILLISADPNAAAELQQAAASDNYRNLKRLPNGTGILAQMCVQRAD